jgi:hypothetical protein
MFYSPTDSEAYRELLDKAMEPRLRVPAHSENLEKQMETAHQWLGLYIIL